MRIGNSLGGVVGWAIVAAATGFSATAGAAERVQTVPIGGTLDHQSGDRNFGVYVPTRFGGVLTIRSTSGRVEAITGPDGRARTNGEEVGMDQQGWYTFRVVGAERPYTVETNFVQVGQAARLPWNYYYWPTKADAIHEPWDGTGDGRAGSAAMGDDEQVIPPGGFAAPGQDIVRAGPDGILQTPVAGGDTSTWFPNLYDDMTFRGGDGTLYATPSPLLKYDQLFSTGARGWEAAVQQNHDISRWPGHCLGGAVASIMLNEPRPVPGSGLSADELKGLWAELGENHFNHQIGDNANNIPAGPPRPGWDPTDASVARFHAMLETHIRGRRKSLLANLRAFPPNGQPGEVWNHGVGKYTATFHAVPGKGERAVMLDVVLQANSGSNLNGSDPKPRINSYRYSLVYGLNGMVDEANTFGNDWVSAGGDAMYCPLNLMEVVNSRWQGHNPMVTEANVRSIDLANGGNGPGRFAGAAPTFRPIGNSAVGRAPIAFGGDGLDGVPGGAPTARSGFFSRIFGR